jgi:hypothetical protein
MKIKQLATPGVRNDPNLEPTPSSAINEGTECHKVRALTATLAEPPGLTSACQFDPRTLFLLFP